MLNKTVLTNGVIFTISSTITVAALFFCSVVPANANLIVYDGFDYAAESQLSGANGGTGWNEATWSTSGASAIVTNAAGTLTYSTLQTSGNSAVVGFNSPDAAVGTVNVARTLPDTFENLAASFSTTTLWMSFLFQDQTTDSIIPGAYRETKLGWFSGSTTNTSGISQVNGSERLDFGVPHTYQTNDEFSVYVGGVYVQSGSPTPRGTSPSDTLFVLVRIDLDTDANFTDSVRVWLNPDLSSEPTVGTETILWNTTTNVNLINSFRFNTASANGSGTNSMIGIDEIRLATTFAEAAPVVPEPAVIALAGIGLTGMLMAFRRKRS